MNATSTKMTLSICTALCATLLSAQNVIPNPSFEEDSDIPNGDYVANVSPDLHTSSWSGGILTAGGAQKTFCSLRMADGQCGMALHPSYRWTMTEFDIGEGGLYVLRFCYAPRLGTPEATFGMYVTVSFDDSMEVVKVAPTVSYKWSLCSVLVELPAGRHKIGFVGELKPGISDASVVIDAVSLEKYNEANLVPNASFEKGSNISGGDYATNVNPDFHTSFWSGGILTCGGAGKTFCNAEMYDGKYGMALHPSYISTELEFSVPLAGKFSFSFACTSRKAGAQCMNAVTAYIDDSPVVSLLPDSCETWKKCSRKIRLQEGTHRLKFVGVAPSGFDSSTVIDGIELRTSPEKGLAIVVR